MNLEQQFMSLGMNADEAKIHADNFVNGLKELGLSDNQNNELTEIVNKNRKLDNILLNVGVRPSFIQRYSVELEKSMILYQIDNKNQQSMFLAQILHESAMLSRVIENLNYSELGLLKVFKKYFDRNTAKRYARNPERIANRVYANRMGNGNEDSGDGWKFRGRGLIQLTGKDNYADCGKGLGVNLLSNPDYLIAPVGATRSAAWFWKDKKLFHSANKGDIETNTKLINGGFNGLDHRTDLYSKILNLY